MIELEYKNMVLKKIIDHKFGEIITDPIKNRSFIEATKVIIDWKDDLKNEFMLEFSDDYKKLFKKKIRKQFEQQPINIQ